MSTLEQEIEDEYNLECAYPCIYGDVAKKLQCTEVVVKSLIRAGDMDTLRALWDEIAIKQKQGVDNES